jgi:hypothetical protein
MRFPIKGTVFTVFFLLINIFFVYLQPAQAENTVTFKMVILPADENTVDSMDKNFFGKYLLLNNHKNLPSSLSLLKESWRIFHYPEML